MWYGNMDEKLIDLAFKQFETLMSQRINRNVHTTEDSARYTLFYCLTNYANLKPDEVILEHPHKPLDRCFVDAYIKPINDEEGLVFEFKYDRGIPSGKIRQEPRKRERSSLICSDWLVLKEIIPLNVILCMSLIERCLHILRIQLTVLTTFLIAS
jgi:hypothetical protein